MNNATLKKGQDSNGSKNGYSDDYKTIKREIESTWPEWKITSYNSCFATSAHANKLTSKEKTTK